MAFAGWGNAVASVLGVRGEGSWRAVGGGALVLQRREKGSWWPIGVKRRTVLAADGFGREKKNRKKRCVGASGRECERAGEKEALLGASARPPHKGRRLKYVGTQKVELKVGFAGRRGEKKTRSLRRGKIGGVGVFGQGK